MILDRVYLKKEAHVFKVEAEYLWYFNAVIQSDQVS